MVGKEEQKEKELQRAVDVSVDALFKLKKKKQYFFLKKINKKIEQTRNIHCTRLPSYSI